MFSFHAALAFSSDTNDNECKTLPLTPQLEHVDEQVLCYLSCKNPGLIPCFDTGTVCVCRGIWSRVVCFLCVSSKHAHAPSLLLIFSNVINHTLCQLYCLHEPLLHNFRPPRKKLKKTKRKTHSVPPYGPRDTFNSALILMSDDTGSPGGQSERREAPVWKEKAWIMAPMD